MRRTAAALCLLLLPATAHAEWVRATGTYLFPPIMPEASWLGPSTVIFVTLSVVLAIWIVVRSYMSMG